MTNHPNRSKNSDGNKYSPSVRSVIGPGGRIVGCNEYAALEIGAPDLMGVAAKIGAADASSLGFSGAPEKITEEEIHGLSTHMLAREAAERFPVGDYELIAARFICGGKPYTIVTIENYPQPYPALVDGHITDRNHAIGAWLGDAAATDHPLLYLTHS